MVTSFLRTVEEHRETVAQLLDRSKPRRKDGVALGGQGVRPFRRARELGLPLGRDEPFVLERAQRPVQVPDVDALLARELGETLDQLVAVSRPSGERDEQSRLAEAFDASADLPLARLAARAVASTNPVATVHRRSICNLHMSVPDAPRRARIPQASTARFASMPASSDAYEAENFSTPSRSSVSVTSS